METTIPLNHIRSGHEGSSMSNSVEGTTIGSSSFLQNHEERHHLLGAKAHSNLSQENSVDVAKDSAGIVHNAPHPSTFRAWWQELVLSIYAIGLFTAIIAVLFGFDKKSQPSWTLGLNLNTVIALLATFLRSGVGMVVEQVLGQAKWSWQQRPRPLRDLARFDEASRGPWGSLVLWFRISLFDRKSRISRHTTSALIATVVTILSLAIGSFTQQAVRPVVCNIVKPGLNASLPVGYGDPSGTYRRPGAGLWDMDVSTKARIFNALSGSSYDRAILINNCSTGNCTFPDIAPGRTLSTPGFCSKCVETTSLIQQRQPNATDSPSPYLTNVLYLPNGLEVGEPGDLMVLNLSANMSWISSRSKMDSETFQAWDVSALTIHILALTVDGCDGPDEVDGTWNCTYPHLGSNKTHSRLSISWNAVGASCVFYPCIQDIHAEVVNGRLSETVVNEVVVSNFTHTSDSPGMYRFPCYIDGMRYDEHNISLAHWKNDLDPWTGNRTDGLPDQCLYRVPWTMFRALTAGRWFPDLFNGSCTMTQNLGSGQYARSWPLCEQWWLSGLYNRGNATFSNISATMNSVATAITDSYRLASITTKGLTHKNTVNGTVWETTICTQFNWPWLLFPATLLILTILSLILMMAPTGSAADRPPVWKSSILPFLYLQDTPQGHHLEGFCTSDMEESAKQERVELTQDKQLRWRLKPIDNAEA